MLCNKPGLLAKRGNYQEAFKAPGMKINQRNNSSHGFCKMFSLNSLKWSLHYKLTEGNKKKHQKPLRDHGLIHTGFFPCNR